MSTTTSNLQRGYSKMTEQFAAKVRDLRRQRGATLQDVAQGSGLSISTLSKIENGQLSPTYETLLRLADGLQVEIMELFPGSEPTAAPMGRRSITRRARGKVLATKQYRYEMFCGDLFRKEFTPLITTVIARKVEEFPQLPRHAGEEFIYVIDGEVELYTEHYEPTRLRQGDGCYFDSTMGHACISVSKSDAVILWIASKADELSQPKARLAAASRTATKP